MVVRPHSKFLQPLCTQAQIFPVVILSDLLMGPELHKSISIYIYIYTCNIIIHVHVFLGLSPFAHASTSGICKCLAF